VIPADAFHLSPATSTKDLHSTTKAATLAAPVALATYPQKSFKYNFINVFLTLFPFSGSNKQASQYIRLSSEKPQTAKVPLHNLTEAVATSTVSAQRL
jgi:hypothetical protein